MEFTGKTVGVVQNFETNRFQITFDVNESAIIRSQYDKIKDLDRLSIKVAKYRQKRSLDANAYCWVLITKIADAVFSSKDEVYEEMLQKYGQFYENEDGGYVTITTTADMTTIPGHWKYISEHGKFKSYLMIKGSSEYDTQEMAHFIDQIIDEAKALGIETLPPEELERMKQEWKP
ncbi:MAG: hypothetical protein PHP50_14240 [Lachnospiraceae bacterium]|nr:hypothetical protein [Lachnospiraceae bacterium]